MSERQLLVSILKLTKTGPIAEQFVSRDAGMSQQVAHALMTRFRRQGLVSLKDNVVGASSNQRLSIALQAIKRGADLERVGRYLAWIEFENIAAKAFEVHNFRVRNRFRFTWAGRRWEIDILARREPLVACVDCKRWRRGWGRSAIAKAAKAQVARTHALASALPMLHEDAEVVGWEEVILVPVVLSLVSGSLKFYNDTPVVPILQLRNFLQELPGHLDRLAHLTVKSV
jgi:Holliday junction resolvase-like predicted endonuclease